MLDQAFDALKTFDWGGDYNALKPIDEAVVETHGDAAARSELEEQLAALLATGISRAAKDYVCRKLMVIGTAASVPALSALLPDADDSHLARYALERIPAPEAAKALRDALPELDGELKIGVISSLGVRQDAASVPALAMLLSDSDAAVAQAAAQALGAIRSEEAAEALTGSDVNADAEADAIDATLACAEAVLAAGNKTKALALYRGLAGGDQPKHVRLAVTRGMLACAGQE